LTSLNFFGTVDQLIRNGCATAEMAFREAPCFAGGSTLRAPVLPARITAINIASANASERIAILRLLVWA